MKILDVKIFRRKLLLFLRTLDRIFQMNFQNHDTNIGRSEIFDQDINYKIILRKILNKNIIFNYISFIEEIKWSIAKFSHFLLLEF